MDWKSYPRPIVDFGVLGPGDASRVDAFLFQKMRGQLVVQIVGGVGEGREDNYLPIAGIDGGVQLAENLALQVLKLGVVGWRDLPHLGQERLDDAQVGAKVVIPGRQVHVGEVDANFAADLLALAALIFVEEVRSKASSSSGSVFSNAGDASVKAASCPVLRKFSIFARVAR